VEFDLNQVRELLAILNQTNIEELCLKSDNFELTIRKGAVAGIAAGTTEMGANAATVIPNLVIASEPAVVVPTIQPDKNWIDITSPMVGTFYRAPAPDEPSFVEIGSIVRPGQTVCIIEAMKLMNELEAEVGGEIMEILVENGKPVEFGQPLMRVKPVS
jgi:acetyl-CoA carboxylase biotin carboxyl carrier protein